MERKVSEGLVTLGRQALLTLFQRQGVLSCLATVLKRDPNGRVEITSADSFRGLSTPHQLQCHSDFACILLQLIYESYLVILC